MYKKINPKDTIKKEASHDYLSKIPKMSKSEQKKYPNIIFILMDDLGWGDLSCFGSKAINTPNIDKMASEGAVLKNCYASSPICSPSRFGLLTGRYPTRGFIEKVFFPTKDIDDKYITTRGYEIEEEEKDGKPTKEFIDGVKTTFREICESLLVEGILEDEITISEILKQRGYKTGMFGKWHLGDKSPYLPNDKGFDYFYGAHYSNDMYPYHFYRNKEIAIEAPFDQRKITEYLNKELFKYIEDNIDNPFFVYYASPWPHHPISAGREFENTSKAGVYGDCIQEFDAGIGELFKLLEEKDILDNTLIVFSSDNGPWHQGSPGFHRGRKGNSFDGGQIVPTICYWKDNIVNDEIDVQAMNIDFYPTFCDITNTSIPKDRIIDGKSLLPLLKGLTDKSPHEKLVYTNSYVSKNQGFAVRSDDNFKFYKGTNSENAMYKGMKIHSFLFDLNNDQNESYDVKNLYPKKYKELKDYLDDFNIEIAKNPRGWIDKY